MLALLYTIFLVFSIGFSKLSTADTRLYDGTNNPPYSEYGHREESEYEYDTSDIYTGPTNEEVLMEGFLKIDGRTWNVWGEETDVGKTGECIANDPEDALGHRKPCTQDTDCPAKHFCSYSGEDDIYSEKDAGSQEKEPGCISDAECNSGSVCIAEEWCLSVHSAYGCTKTCQPEVVKGCQHWGQDCQICLLYKQQNPCLDNGECKRDGKCSFRRNECRVNEDCGSGFHCTVHETTLGCDPRYYNASECPIGECKGYSNSCYTNNDCQPGTYCIVASIQDDSPLGECKELSDEGESCSVSMAINWGNGCKHGLRCNAQFPGETGTCVKEQGDEYSDNRHRRTARMSQSYNDMDYDYDYDDVNSNDYNDGNYGYNDYAYQGEIANEYPMAEYEANYGYSDVVSQGEYADTYPTTEYDDYYSTLDAGTPSFSSNAPSQYFDGFDPDLFEGDIILNSAGDYEYEDGFHSDVVDSQHRWPKQGDVVPVPYEIHHDAPQQLKDDIEWVANLFKAKTCIRLVENVHYASNYIYIDDQPERPSCSSSIGMVGGEQVINYLLDRCKKGTLAHEFMHALGFWHEHTRIDRDKYITIDWRALGNIGKKWSKQYHKCDKGGVKMCKPSNTPYDFDSIMHYTPELKGIPIIKAKRGSPSFGQRETLSELDVKGINILYECGDAYEQHVPSNKIVNPVVIPNKTPSHHRPSLHPPTTDHRPSHYRPSPYPPTTISPYPPSTQCPCHAPNAACFACEQNITIERFCNNEGSDRTLYPDCPKLTDGYMSGPM